MARTRLYDREAAVDAATLLFWDKGFIGTSLKDLEEALAMKPGSIYAAFKSKEALFLLALERYFLQGEQTIKLLYDENASTISSLSNMLRHIGKSGKNDPLSKPCMVIKTLIESESAPHDIVEQARHYHQLMIKQIQTIFDSAQRKGEIKSDLNTYALARKFQANITSLRIEAFLNEDPSDITVLTDMMIADLESLFEVH